MAFLSEQLVVKTSTIPASGMGLFTRKFIPKNTRIIEYKGKMVTWKEVDHREGSNGYIYYIDRKHVVDAYTYKKALGRFANDAMGISRIKGIRNNSEYVTDGLKVFIESARDIAAGEEILVPYGKEYWDVIRHNLKLQSTKR